jgi:hypothetical protein
MTNDSFICDIQLYAMPDESESFGRAYYEHLKYASAWAFTEKKPDACTQKS